jgi:isopentenyl-diphosphate delta-isomerase
VNAPIPAWVEGALAPVPELDVHRRGLRHQAVSVFLMREARTLICRRSLATYLAPGLWSAACHAHPAWGEDARACAVRHLEASLGAGRRAWEAALHHRGQAEYRADLGGGLSEHERVDVFRAEAPADLRPMALAGSAPRRGGSGPAEALWIDLDDLLAEALRRAERFTPWLRVALADHLPLIAG